MNGIAILTCFNKSFVIYDTYKTQVKQSLIVIWIQEISNFNVQVLNVLNFSSAYLILSLNSIILIIWMRPNKKLFTFIINRNEYLFADNDSSRYYYGINMDQ